MQEMWVSSQGQEDSPGGGKGNSLQYSCLENPMDKSSLAGYSPATVRTCSLETKEQQQMLYRKHCLEILSYFISEMFIEHRLCKRFEDTRKEISRAFLVVQWLRLCIPNTGALVPSLVRELNTTRNE